MAKSKKSAQDRHDTAVLRVLLAFPPEITAQFSDLSDPPEAVMKQIPRLTPPQTRSLLVDLIGRIIADREPG